jgi:hypothetical protein
MHGRSLGWEVPHRYINGNIGNFGLRSGLGAVAAALTFLVGCIYLYKSGFKGLVISENLPQDAGRYL